MIKSQRTKIIAVGVVALILIIAYFAVVQPLVNQVVDDSEEPPTLVEGEVLGSNNRILLFEHTEKANIQSIEVHNDSGTWTMYRGDDNEFYLKDHEGAPYSKALLASLVSDAGYTLSMTRVTDNCTDWSVYGLDEASTPAWYVLTNLQGETHTVYIGDRIPTGAGYYCRYKDRPCVYVLQSSLASTLLVPLESMITPMVKTSTSPTVTMYRSRSPSSMKRSAQSLLRIPPILWFILQTTAFPPPTRRCSRPS